MSVNTGPIICTTTAAITHNQRVNKRKMKDEEKTYYTSNETKDKETKYMIDFEYQPITSSKEILEELKFILEQDVNKDESSISVYNVVKLARQKYEQCRSLDINLCHSIESLTDLDSLFIHIDFDFENKQLIIRYRDFKMFFTKQNDDLILVKSNYYGAKNILSKCGGLISNRYDRFIEDISFYRDYINWVQSTNSNFIIDSDEYSIDIEYDGLFKLRAKIYKYDYECNCNSNNVTSICRNREAEIFQKIFIKIDDCPEWTREILYRIRKEQLENIAKIEYKQMKKQKRLELVKRLNLFHK